MYVKDRNTGVIFCAVLVPLKQCLVKNGTYENTTTSQNNLKKGHTSTVESGSTADISCKVDHLGDYTVRNAFSILELCLTCSGQLAEV